MQLDKHSSNCDIIQSSLKRHKKRYFTNGIGTDRQYENSILRNPNLKGAIRELEIVMRNSRACEKFPHENMDEHCEYYNAVCIVYKNMLNSLVNPSQNNCLVIPDNFLRHICSQ